MSDTLTGQATGGIRYQHTAVSIIRLAADGKLDRLDLRIIDALIDDCTAGARRIAKAVGSPVTTVQERMARLRRLVG